MNRFLILPILAFSGLVCIGCEMGGDGGDAGVEPAVEPEPFYICDGDDDEFPGSVVSLEALEALRESGCSNVGGVVVVTPSVLERSEKLADVKFARGLEFRGDFPLGTTMEELSSIERVNSVHVIGDNIIDVSGLDKVTILSGGLIINGAEDLISLRMNDVVSLETAEALGTNTSGGLQVMNAPALVTLGIRPNFELLSGPLKLMNLPMLDAPEAIRIIEMHAALPADLRYDSESEVCGLSDEVGTPYSFPCADD